MNPFIVLVLFIIANCALNIFTSGRLATTGLDFILPVIILMAQAKGPGWGLIAAFLIICAHFFTALNKLHGLPFALFSGFITAVVVGLITAPLETAVTIGIVTYHALSFITIVLFYQRIGIRYFFFMVVNIVFSAWVLGFFY